MIGVARAPTSNVIVNIHSPVDSETCSCSETVVMSGAPRLMMSDIMAATRTRVNDWRVALVVMSSLASLLGVAEEALAALAAEVTIAHHRTKKRRWCHVCLAGFGEE